MLNASLDDLVAMGFTKLQVKKIELHLPKSTTADVSTKTSPGGAPSTTISNTTISSNEVIKSLRSELAELRSQLASLTVTSSSSAARSAAVTSKATPSPPSHDMVVPNFCTKCVISGNQTQVVTITLGPNDAPIQADPGAMVHMNPYIKMCTKASENALGRFFTGQGLFVVEYTYTGPKGTADTICFTPDFPGQIIPVDLSRHGGKIICQKNSLLVSSASIQIQVEFTQSLGAGFFGGEGFILQGLVGRGTALLNARGAIMTMKLRPHERRTVATGCVVAFEASCRYEVVPMPGLANALFGGEGLFVTELTGPGTIWIESHDMSRLYRAMNSKVNSAGPRR